ncbi:MAG: NAD(P)H-quinone oxidoreductase subunit 3 [Actinobacteria bacterium]|nr:MAG: NAD(P)H-quinone oxidoreductase subunit 3 [Actinomycetota bacterium]
MSPFLTDYFYILVFVLVGTAFVMIALGTAKLLGPSKPDSEKASPYECGEVPIGEPWVQFHIRYYVFALLFVIFDIETVFLYPWALVFKKLGLFALVEMIIFLGILAAGLVYAWRKGALKWA